MLPLGEIGSAALLVAMTALVAWGLSRVLDPARTADRCLLLAVSTLLGARYLHWRATETLPLDEPLLDRTLGLAFLALEALAMLSALSANLLMARTRDRRAEADAHARWWGETPPRVAVLIATYNEDLEVLERTIHGATAIAYPNYEVWLLDDGRRAEIRAAAEAAGIRYLARPDNAHAKAGNINHALARFAEGDPPDFVAVLDADFVAHGDFLERALALFHDAEVGLVQTPQHFFNPDPIQANLGLERAYPDEQRFFFNHVQPARDAWGIAICCGTSSVARWEALEAVGFFPTDSVTEDFLLTLVLAERGWRTVYLDEPLSEGLAPEGLEEYITQRVRWCLGLMQIARGRMGPLSRNRLPLRQRWSVVDSVLYWAGTYPFRLAALVVPLFYWFGEVLVVDAAPAEVLAYFGVYFVWALAAINILTRGIQLPLLTEVASLVGAIPITASAYSGLFRPGGRAFKVTPKGGDRSRTVVKWHLMRPFLALFALTLAGLGIGLVSDRFAYYDAADGKAVILFWTVWNLLVLGLTLALCIERPRGETHLDDRPRKGTAWFGPVPVPVWVSDLSTGGARLHGIEGELGERLVLDLKGVARFETTVVHTEEGACGVMFLHDQDSRRALLVELHAAGAEPGTTETRLEALLGALLLPRERP